MAFTDLFVNSVRNYLLMYSRISTGLEVLFPKNP